MVAEVRLRCENGLLSSSGIQDERYIGSYKRSTPISTTRINQYLYSDGGATSRV
jgi:hypothetical protein